jgi:glyoxylase-like metal-dependent hydrolase (beta-lactamase superfamily II)
MRHVAAIVSIGIAWAVAPGAARQGPPVAAGDIRLVPVQRSVQMVTGAGANVTVQIGSDGLLLVDTPPDALAPRVLEAIRAVSAGPVHTVIATHVHPDHTGGTAAVAKLRGTQPVRVIGHDNVLRRMVSSPSEAPVASLRINAVTSLPVTSTYFTPTRDFFLNGEAIVLYHAPAAHTDGDTIVFFRGSDVISTGDVFAPDRYPVIDLQAGGTVNGVIAALNRILELAVPARNQEGGTYVIPGHGRLCDEAEVVEYRDMVTIVRDRVLDLRKKGMTLEQVKAAGPSRDYDTEYGDEATAADAFVDAVYRSLPK